MISNVQLNAATQLHTVGKASDYFPVNEIEPLTVGVTDHDDRVEISNKAHTASQNSQIVKEVAPMSRDFLEVFSTNFWSHGTKE